MFKCQHRVMLQVITANVYVGCFYSLKHDTYAYADTKEK